MEKTKLIILRHGESLGNAVRVMLGHTDLDLSEKGHLQAETTARALADEKIDFIYSSDLLRAMSTAIPHAKIRNMEIIGDRRLREVDIGKWENRSVDDIVSECGDVFENEWHKGFGTFVFPGGECVKDSGERFYNCVLELCEKHKGKTLLVSSHAAVIRSFWAKATGILPEKIVGRLDFPTNASYSVMEYCDGSFIPVEYSHDEHLSAVGITKVNT